MGGVDPRFTITLCIKQAVVWWIVILVVSFNVAIKLDLCSEEEQEIEERRE